MTAMRADRSRTLYGPSVTYVSLELSSSDGFDMASDGSRKIHSNLFEVVPHFWNASHSLNSGNLEHN